jgi:integrase
VACPKSALAFGTSVCAYGDVPRGARAVTGPRNLLRHFYAVRKRARLEAYRFHGIRHTAVSLLLDLGVPPHVVREILGHSAIEVAMDV